MRKKIFSVFHFFSFSFSPFLSPNSFLLTPIFYLLILFYLLAPHSLFALTLTATENVSISANVGETTPPEPPGGGGGVNIPKTSVRFSGEAYPDATVTLLKNGETVAIVKADNAGFFSITLPEKYDSTILFSLFAKDVAGNKSILLN